MYCVTSPLARREGSSAPSRAVNILDTEEYDGGDTPSALDDRMAVPDATKQ